MTLHKLVDRFGINAIGFVSYDADGTGWYSMGSASGPLSPMFRDLGELTPGMDLTLHFDYDRNEYAAHNPATGNREWGCRVVRINRKSVTVLSTLTENTHRIEL